MTRQNSSRVKRIAIFGGSFNPPGVHHRKIVEMLAVKFDQVKVIPCGPRPDKKTTNDIAPLHRAVMCDLTFSNIASNVSVELFDLENNTFTPNYELQKIYEYEGEIWHVVGTDIILGGKSGNSDIQQFWVHGKEIWDSFNFVVIKRKDIQIDPNDLPTHSIVFDDDNSGASENIRNKCFNHQSIDGLVVPEVKEYLKRHNLYRGQQVLKYTQVKIIDPKPFIFADEMNSGALALKDKFAYPTNDSKPNLILVIGGDRTMLRAIQKYWRLRLPFLGINAGHLGFLLNNAKDQLSVEFLRSDFICYATPLLYTLLNHVGGSKSEIISFPESYAQVEIGRTGVFELIIDNEKIYSNLMADGLLVATAAGSTAYARAMGASPLKIGMDGLVVVGSNVFSENYEPLIWRNGATLSHDSVVEIINKDLNGWRRVYAVVNGNNMGEITSMTVRISRIAAAELLFIPDFDIARKLVRVQFPHPSQQK